MYIRLHVHCIMVRTDQYFMCKGNISCFVVLTLSGHMEDSSVLQRKIQYHEIFLHSLTLLVPHLAPKMRVLLFKFFSSIILEAIVQQMNLFANQKGVEFNFCLQELKAFLGINIAMGILQLPQVRDY